MSVSTLLLRATIVVLVLFMCALFLFRQDIQNIYKSYNPVVVENVDASPPPNAMRVLFVGNSHTFTYQVPRQVAHILKNTPGARPVWFETALYPGVDLFWHAKSGRAMEMLSQPWDVVLLQSQSLEPVYWPEGYAWGAKTLVHKAREAGTKKIVLWETWPRRAGDPIYKASGTFASSPKELGRMLHERIHKMGDQLKVDVAPVGTRWMEVEASRKFSKNALYADSNHASLLGSHLAACVLSQEISGKLCEETTWVLPGVAPAFAEIVRRGARGEKAK